ncbi:MAG: FixH family protein [Planctomycetota bacterium]
MTMDTSQNDKAEHRRVSTEAIPRGRVWVMPAVIFGLLGGQMIFITTAITLATGDRSFAVVPDYYQKAVDWDEHRADLLASEQMGWTLEVLPGESPDEFGKRPLLILVRDAEDQAIRGARVRVAYFHHARAGDHHSVELAEVLPGHYAAEAQIARHGRWQFDVEVERGAQRFVASVQQHVPKSREAE